MEKLDSTAGNEWRAPDQKPDDYHAVIRNGVEFHTFSGKPDERPFVYDEDTTDPMRNTLSGSLTELRAWWLAVIDPLMRLLTRWLDAVMALIERARKG